MTDNQVYPRTCALAVCIIIDMKNAGHIFIFKNHNIRIYIADFMLLFTERGCISITLFHVFFPIRHVLSPFYQPLTPPMTMPLTKDF